MRLLVLCGYCQPVDVAPLQVEKDTDALLRHALATAASTSMPTAHSTTDTDDTFASLASQMLKSMQVPHLYPSPSQMHPPHKAHLGINHGSSGLTRWYIHLAKCSEVQQSGRWS